MADVIEAKATAEQGAMLKGLMVALGVGVAKSSGPMFGNKVSREETAAIETLAAVLRVEGAAAPSAFIPFAS
jgi:hypothetical protein